MVRALRVAAPLTVPEEPGWSLSSRASVAHRRARPGPQPQLGPPRQAHSGAAPQGQGKARHPRRAGGTEPGVAGIQGPREVYTHEKKEGHPHRQECTHKMGYIHTTGYCSLYIIKRNEISYKLESR